MKLKDFDFRVWDNGINDIDGEYLAMPDNVFYDYQCIKRKGVESNYEKYYQKLELERYTGFRDKNDNKIYEGDIVSYRGQNLLVSYDRATWYIINPSMDKDMRIDCGTRLQGILERMKYHDKIDTENQIDIEVIGNIHEDENLLDNSIEQNNPNKTRKMK